MRDAPSAEKPSTHDRAATATKNTAYIVALTAIVFSSGE